jgi:DNA-binding XRE family transcriptional regulator
MRGGRCFVVEIVLPAILDDSGRRMTFAAGVKEIRRRFGLSTGQLARECQVSRRTVEGWEQGRPLKETALELLHAYLARQRRLAERILKRRQGFM